MENLVIYYATSYATLLSAFLGFIFSVMAIRSSDCTGKTTAFYLFARVFGQYSLNIIIVKKRIKL